MINYNEIWCNYSGGKPLKKLFFDQCRIDKYFAIIIKVYTIFSFNENSRIRSAYVKL